MPAPSRRALLCGTASVIALSAGCLGDDAEDSPTDGNETDDNGDPGTPSGDDDNPEDSDDGDEQATELAGSDSRTYRYPTRSTSPGLHLLEDDDEATTWLAERDRTADSLETFVDETDFETSILVSLEAGAPNPCHELALESTAVEDEQVVLDGAVSETSDDDEACIAQETTVGRLVRATFDGQRLTTVSVTIVDRNGESHQLSVSHDTASESTSAEPSNSSDEAGDDE
ncbi:MULTISPECIES: hypothetical protein [unclassified Natrinema]|uniref:hypothetical protein n=1 Tax=unclassified Natrinema TaxID=2622230 RepID=UPI0002A816C8|nr:MULTISPECIES: hypothetical protein [unclassified Natrinema]AFO58654.2 hypothetical protein NJ7G_3436 [Natrinema sp. J7-2]